MQIRQQTTETLTQETSEEKTKVLPALQDILKLFDSIDLAWGKSERCLICRMGHLRSVSRAGNERIREGEPAQLELTAGSAGA